MTKTSCEFRFGFWDVTAQGDASLSASQNQPWTSLAGINVDDPVKFPDVATLEPDFGWPLNGSKDVFPDAPSDSWGLWSTEQSGTGGFFEHPPALTVRFNNVHSSAGITLSFFATLPRLVNIKWYGTGDVLLADDDFLPDAFTYVCNKQVDNYKKIVISIKSLTASNRFLRCTQIVFGLLEILDGTRVEKASLTEETSISSLSLPVNTLELCFYSADGRFSLVSPSGAYRSFQWKQRINAYAYVGGHRRFMGTYYLQNASNETDNLTNLTLVDSIGVLDTVSFFGGMYFNEPVTSILDSIIPSEGFQYSLSPGLSDAKLSGHIPMCNKREALRQIAFALGAVVDTTRSEIIRIYPAPSSVSHTIGANRKVVGHTINMEELVSGVNLTAHTFKQSDALKELASVELSTGRHMIAHQTPAAVTSVSGAAQIETHPNYTIVNLSVAGVVKLNGYEYLDTQTKCLVQSHNMPDGAKKSIKQIENAYLVSPDRGMSVAQNVYNYYQRRYTDEGTILPGDETLGQVIQLENVGGHMLTGSVERLHIDLAGGYLTKITMRGA